MAANKIVTMIIKTKYNSPDWCGSVGWVLSHKPKGCRFLPGQSTCLGCGPGPELGLCERQPTKVYLARGCFPLSFPSPLKINK